MDAGSEVEDHVTPRPRRFRMVVVAMAVVVALGAAEMGLRIRHDLAGTYALDAESRTARENSIWHRSADPLLVYEHRPDAPANGPRQTESHGILRPTAVALPKPSGGFRVAVLGDSVTAGLALPYRRRFTALLERSLSRASELEGRTVEVLNFAVDGYDTLQEARLLEVSVGRFDPDVVVVVYCMNDVTESVTPVGWFRDRERPWSEVAAVVGSVFGAAGIPPAPVAGPGEEPEEWRRLYDPAGPGWRRVEEGLDRIAKQRTDGGFPVLFVLFPLLDRADPSGAHAAPLRAQVIAAAEKRSFAVLDLTPVFAAYDAGRLQYEQGDVYHPNAGGHGIAAAALHDAVLRLK